MHKSQVCLALLKFERDTSSYLFIFRKANPDLVAFPLFPSQWLKVAILKVQAESLTTFGDGPPSNNGPQDSSTTKKIVSWIGLEGGRDTVSVEIKIKMYKIWTLLQEGVAVLVRSGTISFGHLVVWGVVLECQSGSSITMKYEWCDEWNWKKVIVRIISLPILTSLTKKTSATKNHLYPLVANWLWGPCSVSKQSCAMPEIMLSAGTMATHILRNHGILWTWSPDVCKPWGFSTAGSKDDQTFGSGHEALSDPSLCLPLDGPDGLVGKRGRKWSGWIWCQRQANWFYHLITSQLSALFSSNMKGEKMLACLNSNLETWLPISKHATLAIQHHTNGPKWNHPTKCHVRLQRIPFPLCLHSLRCFLFSFFFLVSYSMSMSCCHGRSWEHMLL